MIIQKLIELECEAKEAIHTLEKEQSHYFTQAEMELEHDIAQLHREKDETIMQLEHALDVETEKAIEKIRVEFGQKRSDYVSAFSTQQKSLCNKVMQMVLYSEINEKRS